MTIKEKIIYLMSLLQKAREEGDFQKVREYALKVAELIEENNFVEKLTALKGDYHADLRDSALRIAELSKELMKISNAEKMSKAKLI